MKSPDARPRWCLLFIFCALSLGTRLVASPFYEYKIIAKSGDTLDGFPAQSFKRAVSLNDNGHVAFIGESAAGAKAVFVAEPGGGYVLHKLAESSTGDYGSVWVNNRNEVAASFTAVSGGITSANVRRYHSYSSTSGGAYPFDDILKGTTARYTAVVDPCLPLATCPFTLRFRVKPFDYVMDPVSINDSGMVACLGTAIFDGGQTFYYLTAQNQYRTNNDPSTVLPQQVFGFMPDFKPVIANSGEIVARVGNRDDAPILLYAPGLGTPQVIANLVSFTKIGQCPGLSDDGQVVAFYGDLKPDRTKQITLQNGEVVPFPITPGPGIFASVRFGTNTARYLVRVAGLAKNGQIDPGELMETQPDGTLLDRGQDFTFRQNYNSPLTWELQSFSTNTPIAVSGAQSFSDVTNGSFVTVVYLATDSAGRLGIYSSRINLLNPHGAQGFTIGVEAPMLVARNNDTLFDAAAGQSIGPISDLAINDAVNTNGDMAALVSAGGIQYILNATRLETDAVVNDPDDTDSALGFTPAKQAQPLPEPLLKSLKDIDSPLVEYVKTSKYFDDRPTGVHPTQIVVHATDGNEVDTVNEFLGKVEKPRKVSAHFLVNKEGRITQFVAVKQRANHARNLAAAPETDPDKDTKRRSTNNRSIGIELEGKFTSGGGQPLQLITT